MPLKCLQDLQPWVLLSAGSKPTGKIRTRLTLEILLMIYWKTRYEDTTVLQKAGLKSSEPKVHHRASQRSPNLLKWLHRSGEAVMAFVNLKW